MHDPDVIAGIARHTDDGTGDPVVPQRKLRPRRVPHIFGNLVHRPHRRGLRVQRPVLVEPGAEEKEKNDSNRAEPDRLDHLVRSYRIGSFMRPAFSRATFPSLSTSGGEGSAPSLRRNAAVVSDRVSLPP